MKAKLVRALVLGSLIACTPSCTSFEIEGSGDRDKRAFPPSVKETIHGSFWGFMWGDRREVSKCEKNHELFRIEYHQNALLVFASVVSLGFYVPQDVEWWCVEREDPQEDEGPSLKKNRRKY